MQLGPIISHEPAMMLMLCHSLQEMVVMMQRALNPGIGPVSEQLLPVQIQFHKAQLPSDLRAEFLILLGRSILDKVRIKGMRPRISGAAW